MRKSHILNGWISKEEVLKAYELVKEKPVRTDTLKMYSTENTREMLKVLIKGELNMTIIVTGGAGFIGSNFVYFIC